ncbi:unnamed protein product [Urochloa humidicola]
MVVRHAIQRGYDDLEQAAHCPGTGDLWRPHLSHWPFAPLLGYLPSNWRPTLSSRRSATPRQRGVSPPRQVPW